MKLQIGDKLVPMRPVKMRLIDADRIVPMDGSALNEPENTWFLCNEKALYSPEHEIFIAAVGWSLQEFKIYNRDLVEVRDESQGRSTPEPSLEDIRIAPSMCALGNLKK
jgi:hypothetical protein